MNRLIIQVRLITRGQTYRLVGSLDWDVQILGLSLGERSEFDIELGYMSSGNFLVEFLGQDVDAKREFLWRGPKSDLSEDLVREGTRHNERRVTSGTSDVNG